MGVEPSGLDRMNFFIADVQPVSVRCGVLSGAIGLVVCPYRIALSVGAIAGMLGQIPGGVLADAVTWKRGLASAGIIMTAFVALILALVPDIASLFIAQILQGATAVSLRLPSALSVLAWSDAALCRCVPAGTIVISPLATH